MKKTPWLLGYWTLLRMSIRMKKKLPVYMPTREFIDGCWRLAFLDDMVCRHELDGVVIKGQKTKLFLEDGHDFGTTESTFEKLTSTGLIMKPAPEMDLAVTFSRVMA